MTVSGLAATLGAALRKYSVTSSLATLDRLSGTAWSELAPHFGQEPVGSGMVMH
jgi:hypothetical protein